MMLLKTRKIEKTDFIPEFGVIIVSCCPICGSSKIQFVINKYDDRFGQPDLFKYYCCKKCNVAFLGNKIQEKYLPELYKKYYGKHGQPNVKSSRLKLILEKMWLDKIVLGWLAGNKLLLNNVRKNSKVLEIGPGYNPELKKIVLSRRLDWTGLEVDEESVNSLMNNGLRVIHGTMKLDNIADKFDYIVCSQSIEHQYDVNDFFDKLKGLLKSEGTVIFTTPNFDSRHRIKYKEKWINWHAPYHTIILSKKAIINLCIKHGFVVSKIFTHTPTSWYMLQKNFEIPRRGELNTKFNFNFSLMRQLFVSVFLRIYELFDRNTGDCIYCELKLKG